MPKREINPVPEMIAGMKWEVRQTEKEGQAYVDLKKKQMIVPLDESEKSELIRSHELMHVAISPFAQQVEVDVSVEDRTIQSIEDCRIWSELKRVGVDPSKVDIAAEERMMMPLIRPYILKKGGNEDAVQLEVARLILARRNTGSEVWLREGAKQIDCERSLEAVDEIVEKFFQPYESKNEQVPFDAVLEACSYLHKFFSAVPPEGEGNRKGDKNSGDGEGLPTDSKPGDEEAESDSPGEGEGQNQKESNQTGKPDKPEPEKRKTVAPISPLKINEEKVEKLPLMSKSEIREAAEAGINNPIYSGTPTGSMEILRPALTVKHRPSKGRRKVTTDLGVNPKNLYRATIDQKVFSEKAVRDYGVAIIIDCSGSMNVSPKQIEQIMDECPAAVVGLYASRGRGYDYSRSSLQSGVLKIIVENKMRIDPRINLHEGMGGGNVVDLPAIEWLSRRKESRKIWVCDGAVTGKEDMYLCAEDVRKITRLVLDNNIVNVRNLAELVARRRELIG